MAVDTSFTSLSDSLKLEDPWLPPRPWEAIPSEGRHTQSSVAASSSHSSLSKPFYDASTISEDSLVRLAMNALQGVEPAVISIEKLGLAFCSYPADRTHHRMGSLWNRSSSTLALGNMLVSIGLSGCIACLLYKFVDYFARLDLNGDSSGNYMSEDEGHPSCSLVNQAFAVAIRKVLDGYISALNTLQASICMRCSSKTDALLSSSDVGCLTSVSHSELTLLEVYLHTSELRTHVEALGNICSLHDIALCFPVIPFEDLLAKANIMFCNFPRGGKLLTYLYMELKVADPVHSVLLKFLFLRAFEPYHEFIKLWIYKAEINDPHKEFIVDYENSASPCSWVNNGISMSFQLATLREHDGVAIPSFLEDLLVPLFRAGQQLQVLTKVLELCNHVGIWNNNFEDMLQCLNKLSMERPFYDSLLTFSFSKEWMKETVVVRDSFYRKMMDNLENLLTKSDFHYQQVVAHCTATSSNNNVSSSRIPVLLEREGGSSSSTDIQDQNLLVSSTESEVSTTKDGSQCMEDPEDRIESSECSSTYSLEWQNEPNQLIHFSDSIPALEQKYLSVLCFSSNTTDDTSLQKPSEQETSTVMRDESLEASKRMGYLDSLLPSQCKGTAGCVSLPPSMLLAPHLSQAYETQYSYFQHDLDLTLGSPLGSHLYLGGGYVTGALLVVNDGGLKVGNRMRGVLDAGASNWNNIFIPEFNAVKKEAIMHYDFRENYESLNSLSSQALWKQYHSNFFSVNPILAKNNFTNLKREYRENCVTDNIVHSSSFDFTSVKDPCKASMERLTVNSGHPYLPKISNFHDNVTSAALVVGGYNDKKDHISDEDPVDKMNLSKVGLHFPSKPNWEDILSASISGGSSWESLLGYSDDKARISRDQKMSLAASSEMPLDFVIRKCLSEQILLQYRYVSKLTIKLLEQVFGLQEHLMALRRYHLMELADWADLFVSSLSRHKWNGVETEKRIPEIQGILELSLQRSSCESDFNKGRLYVYAKQGKVLPFSNSVHGLHAFDFLGLGYRVDWPVSIVLTSDALKIYSELFSFLVQVKLSLLSLRDAWSSLKNCSSGLRENKLDHFSILMKVRHQVNHFVSTLQQYVQSQLSHASWCKFFNSHKNKVKDMMDLESVHMAYLRDSLDICFLSEETRTMAILIRSILQGALDFRSCLIGINWNTEAIEKGLMGELSERNFHQVLAIKQAFEKNIRELYLSYLRSPRHVEYGITRFWDYLNYNDYYTGVISK